MLSRVVIWGEFFPKKFLMGGTFLDKFMRGKFKSCSLDCRWRHGELVWPRDKPVEEVCLGRLGVGGNYLWCLVIIVIFVQLVRAKRLGGQGDFKVIIWGRASNKGGGQFNGEELTPWLWVTTITFSTLFLLEKYIIIFCILSIPHNIFITAINKLTKSLKNSDLAKNLINWFQRVTSNAKKAFSVADWGFN